MKRLKIRQWLLSILLACALIVAGCDGSATQSATSDNVNAVGDPTVSPVAQAQNSPMSNLPKLEGKATVEMTVNGSLVTIEVDGTSAPITAGNFIDLVNQGVYDGVAFHRVVREPQPFVVQGGDPQSKNPKVPMAQLGTGGFIDPATSQERYIPLEIQPAGAEQPLYSQTFDEARIKAQPKLKHSRGAVAMARSRLPDSASSQFYFALADLPFLDGSYAVFGYVTEGMDVIDQVQQGDRIESAKVTAGLDNLKK
ncbi:MAG: peptidylprolyl isomerase [Limnoraphis robusta]|uniref:peptidylprolyl isomerase n=1 Tax=Limnoraphis robusta TaxID=1118279 RepID=UPI002B1EB20B|nr:peptidylprolyl isomerase [Limnoraphis robusta]MEA5501345.1 peptidylprolyl isomerase [Limnoraphis robusta BA-68 BA1]MEA5540623.1 peptidylprolyl isomerase [Limnoraphis robusta Tam1]